MEAKNNKSLMCFNVKNATNANNAAETEIYTVDYIQSCKIINQNITS